MSLITNLLSALPRPKLLVVDDQPVNIRALHELFRDDYDVLMAKSGMEALRICESQLPDLVLLDVIMAGIDGYEVCRRLKANAATADIPVVFLTGNNEEMDEVFGFAMGAVDYIRKPIQPVVVRTRVKTHLAVKQQGDLLRTIALTDGLTGIANRRKFDADLEMHWRQCQRSRTPLSLILIDVDHFKRYNDHYGHQAGDQCLKTIAITLRSVLGRPYDLVARYGGEEFAAILPGTDDKGTLHVAEKMIVTVRRLGLEHVASDAAKTVTISAGVATQLPSPATTLQTLITTADEHLYAAKKAGRDRACSAPETPSE